MADRSVESPARQKSGGAVAVERSARRICTEPHCQVNVRDSPTVSGAAAEADATSEPRVTAAGDSRGVRKGKDAMASTLLSAVAWVGDGIAIIDQTRLPTSCEVLRLSTVDAAIDAIQRLAVRGAPAVSYT